MELEDYLAAFRRSLWMIIAVTLAAASLAAFALSRGTDLFKAESQILLAAVSSPDVNAIYTSQQIVLRNLATYSALVTSPAVLDQVDSDLGLDRGDYEVASSYQEGETLITVAVLSTSAEAARTIADSAAGQSVTLLNAEPDDEGARVVNATVVAPATLPTAPAGTSPYLVIAAALLAGLLLGMMLALIRRRLDRTFRSPASVASALGIPVLGQLPYRFPSGRPGAEESVLIAATTLARGWDPGGHRLLIAPPDSGDNTLELAHALSAGFAGLQMSTTVIDGASLTSESRVRVGGDAAAPASTRVRRSSKANPQRDQWPLAARLQAVRRKISTASDGTQVMLILAPPLADGPDALLLADLASECLLMVREGHTTRSGAAEALRVLTSAGVDVRGVLYATEA